MTSTSEAAVTETAASSVPAAFAHRPALDGVRTVAVMLVVAFHAGMSSLSNGFVGVDVFFVLSGFLVTNILLTELARTDTVKLRRFYARRIRRLLPASAALITAAAFMWSGLVPVTERPSVATDAQWAALYAANWRFVGSATDYFAETLSPSPFLHFWSLAIEEQFYMVFPLVVVGLWRLSKRGRRSVLPIGLAAILLVSLGLQLFWVRQNTVRAYYGTDARLYQLLAGALLAVVLARRRSQLLTTLQAAVCALVGLVGVLLIATSAIDLSLSNRGIAATIASLVLLVGLELGPTTLIAQGFARPTIVHLGQISYGTYLWHWPIVLAVQRLLVLPPWVVAIVVTILATAMAELSSTILERPIRRNPTLDKRPRSVIVCGLALGVIVAVVATALLSTDAPSRLVRAESSSPAVPTDLATELGPSPRNVDWNAVAAGPGSGIGPRNHTCYVGSLDDCVVVQGSDTSERVLLVGDSHSRVMLPMLTAWARSRDITLLASNDNGCGWIEGLREWAAGESNVDRCDGRRDRWTTELVGELDLDAVLLVQRDRDPKKFADGRSELVDPAEQALGFPDGVNAAITRTVGVLVDQGLHVVIVEPTPIDTTNPIACLADSPMVADCVWTTDMDPSSTEKTMRRLDKESDVVTTISLDDIACPRRPLCIPYLGGEFVYKDDDHVQPDWWVSHLDEVGPRLDDALR